jgi:hypothetical protein
MPFNLNIRPSNRSQQALDNSLNQAQRGPPINPASASTGSGDENKAYDPRNSLPPLPHEETYSYNPANEPPAFDNRAYQEFADRPSRSQSQRVTSGYPSVQPPSSNIDPRAGTLDDQALADYGKPYNTAPNPKVPQSAVEPKKSKSSRFFGGFKSSRATEQPATTEQQSSHNNLTGLGRRISIRHKEPAPGLQTQSQNISTDRQYQVPGWQSGQSSESQLESPHEADEEQAGADRYIIHHSDQDRERNPGPGANQIQNPTIHLPGGDQESTVRLVDEGWQRQNQQPPQLNTQQQWPGPHNQQVQGSPLPISPVASQLVDYQQPNSQSGHYQTYPSPSQQIPPNTQFRSNTNPEVVSQFSHDSPVEAPDDQRPVSVQSNSQTSSSGVNYSSHLQTDYPARSIPIAGTQGPRPLAQQSAMPPPPAPSQSRRSADTKQTLQPEGRSGPPPSYSAQQSFGSNSGPGSNPINPQTGAQQPGNYRPSTLQRDYSQTGGAGDHGRSTPPIEGGRDKELTEMDKLGILCKSATCEDIVDIGNSDQIQEGQRPLFREACSGRTATEHTCKPEVISISNFS